MGSVLVKIFLIILSILALQLTHVILYAFIKSNHLNAEQLKNIKIKFDSLDLNKDGWHT